MTPSEESHADDVLNLNELQRHLDLLAKRHKATRLIAMMALSLSLAAFLPSFSMLFVALALLFALMLFEPTLRRLASPSLAGVLGSDRPGSEQPSDLG